MSSLQNIVSAVGTSSHDGSDALQYKKGPSATGEVEHFQERVLDLAFLRCVRRDLVFQLSANNSDADKFDDVVVVWRPKEHFEARTMLVQLKHKTSPSDMTISSEMVLSRNPYSGFGLGWYSASYEEISKVLDMKRVTCVLLTNAWLHESALDIFEHQDVDSVPGLELLQTGGELYRLNPNHQQLLETVRGNSSFVQHFFLLCRQNNCVDIVRDIHMELDALLGASNLCESISERLCKSIREWMNEASVCLTIVWRKWQALVDEYIKKHVSECRAVTTRLRYCSVADVRGYLESCNPAWVRPPERETGALSATKIHQAVADERHIMVPVERFTEQRHQFSERRHRILRCWGTLCQWLVIISDDREGNFDILSKLVTRIGSERRLVIVSSRETNNSFADSCLSSDVSDDSWKECLDVRLNGDLSERCLRDLVAGDDAIKSLKSLLDDEPARLQALALRVGQESELPPGNYTPKDMVPVDLLSSLGFRDVCVTDSVSYESLKSKIGRHSVTSFAEVGSWILNPSKFEWPLFVVADNLNAIQEKIRRLPIFKFHIISRISSEKIRELLAGLVIGSNVGIVERTPRVDN